MDTGYEALDEKFNMLSAGEVTLLTGPTGVGKTSLAVNIAYNNMTVLNNSVLYFTLDEGMGELGERFIHLDTEIPLFRRGNEVKGPEEGGYNESPEDREDISKSAEKFQHFLDNDFLKMCDDDEITLADMQSLICDHFSGFDFVIIDPLEKIKISREPAGDNSDMVKLIFRELKKTARSLEVPFLLLSRMDEKEAEKYKEVTDKIVLLKRHDFCPEKRKWDREMKVKLNCIPEPAILEFIYNATGSRGEHRFLWEAPLMTFKEHSEEKDKIMSDIFSDLKNSRD